MAESDAPRDRAIWRVFISHTDDLRTLPAGRCYVDEAERAISAAGHVIVDMADFPASDQSPAQICMDRVRSCDVYLGVLGTRYGSPVRDRPQVSYTELEFGTATEAGLPRLMFLLDASSAEPGQEEFRDRVQESGLLTQSFTSPAELGRLVERSLRELAERTSPAGPAKVVFGEIPHAVPSFQERPELQDQLINSPPSRGVIFALTGSRGAGKSQLAAAVARKRLAEGWRLVAWVNAELPGQLIEELGQLATELGLGTEGSASAAALRLRHWLESDGARCLLVLDNAADAAAARSVLPAAGRAHVIVTSWRRPLFSLGTLVPVGVFTGSQATGFLTSRTGQADETGALALAADLGYLPLALSQAAAVIAGQRLDYAAYRERLADIRVADYLTHTEEDPYPLGVAEAIMLSMSAVEERQAGGTCRQVLELLSVLSAARVSRKLVYRAASRIGSEVDLDAALQALSDSSLITWSLDGSAVTMHQLVARVVRERADHDGTLPPAAHRTIDFLALAWGEPGDNAEVERSELASHIIAVANSLSPFRYPVDVVHAGLLLLLLTRAGPYLLGHDHGYRHGFAVSLDKAGRSAEAIAILEQLVADMERQKDPRLAGLIAERVKDVKRDLSHMLQRGSPAAEDEASDGRGRRLS